MQFVESHTPLLYATHPPTQTGKASTLFQLYRIVPLVLMLCYIPCSTLPYLVLVGDLQEPSLHAPSSHPFYLPFFFLPSNQVHSKL